ncbi:MAG: RcnB family protein [Phenylobacterium sp.]
MRRLISLLAAVVIVAGPLATAGAAMAKDEHREEHREQQAPRGALGRLFGGGRQNAPAYRGAQEYRYERPEMRDPRSDPRSDPRNDPRNDPRMNGYRSEASPDPRYDPRAYGPAAPAPNPYYSAPRRGGYVGPGTNGAVIQDPGRYRLRPPPRGYVWMRTPNGMAMVSQSTGQIYDMVPYPPY